jgi:hypothetical protein
MYQCWADIQFHKLEVSILVSITKNQSGIQYNIWSEFGIETKTKSKLGLESNQNLVPFILWNQRQKNSFFWENVLELGA